MKKIVNLSFTVVLVLGLLMINLPKNVVAAAAPKSLIADGAWSTGTEVAVDLNITSAPTWLQLLTSGVKITAPAKICHPFQGGQFHWVGEIRQLVKGKWVKLPTVSDWVPSTEGIFTACAQAPAAGTYALFGYYNGPLEIVSGIPSGTPFDCSTVDWIAVLINTPPSDEVFVFPYFANVPIGTPVTYTVTGMDPAGSFGGDFSGSGTVADTGYVSFVPSYLLKIPPRNTLKVDFSLLGCTFTKVFTFTDNQ